ncbi:hypothetical protein ACIRQP_16285 [Streptomyces sp. NPDC102274]|uniref:hypothetical protein n=1 Tax=Streptomyces sp. NPDC102274 TaxID=3366151 RepID=UPI00382CC008
MNTERTHIEVCVRTMACAKGGMGVANRLDLTLRSVQGSDTGAEDAGTHPNGPGTLRALREAGVRTHLA